MCLGSPKAPKAPAVSPPPPAVPQAAVAINQNEVSSRDVDRRRNAGRQGTILSGGQGLQSQANTGKTILGG